MEITLEHPGAPPMHICTVAAHLDSDRSNSMRCINLCIHEALVRKHFVYACGLLRAGPTCKIGYVPPMAHTGALKATALCSISTPPVHCSSSSSFFRLFLILFPFPTSSLPGLNFSSSLFRRNVCLILDLPVTRAHTTTHSLPPLRTKLRCHITSSRRRIRPPTPHRNID